MSIRLGIVTALVAIGLTSTASAQSTRTWVSGVGDDANPCSRTAPCATIAGALAVTAVGGEISVLDAQDYALFEDYNTGDTIAKPVTITKSVTITGAGSFAGSIGSTAGITIAADASSTVILRNLEINGGLSGGDGVTFVSGGTLTIQNSTIHAFAGNGIAFTPATAGGRLFLRNVVVRDNTGAGLLLSSGDGAAVNAMVERSSLVGNGSGASLFAGTAATLFDSVLSFNGGAAISVASGTGTAQVNVEDATIASNDFGVDVSSSTGGSAVVRLSNTFVDAQATALTRVVGTGSVLTYGNDRFVRAPGTSCASGYVTLLPASFPAGTTGTAYAQSMSALGALGAVSFSSQGNLPPGLALTDGVLAGTPTKAGSYPVTITGTDGSGCPGSVATTLQMVCPAISLAPTAVSDATTGVDLLVPFTQSEGSGSVSFQLTGTLPSGVTFENATLSGYPTDPGTFAFTVTATDAYECIGTTTYSLTVNPSADHQETSLALSSSSNPVESGAALTVTATVTATSGAPSGTVTFLDGSTLLGSGAVANGEASLQTTFHGVGTRSLSAVYSGDRTYGTSKSTAFDQTVGAASTTTTLVSNGPTAFGEAAIFTATVSSLDGIPSGSIEFLDGTTVLGTEALDASGKASFSTSSFDAGSHSITARYVGTTDFLTSTSSDILQVVSPASTMTSLRANGSSIVGDTVTFMATVTSLVGTPTGEVSFLDGDTLLESASVKVAGVATFSTAALAVGVHSITARYGGTANLAPSVSAAVTQTVMAASFTVTVAQAPQALTGQSGVSAKLKYTVDGPLDAAIQLSCRDLPANTACSFDPAQVGAARGETSVTVTITQAKTVSNEGNDNSKLALAALAPLLLMGWRTRRKQIVFRSFTLAFGLVAMLGLSACGGKTPTASGIPAGNYKATVVSTSGAITVTTPLEFSIK